MKLYLHVLRNESENKSIKFCILFVLNIIFSLPTSTVFRLFPVQNTCRLAYAAGASDISMLKNVCVIQCQAFVD